MLILRICLYDYQHARHVTDMRDELKARVRSSDVATVRAKAADGDGAHDGDGDGDVDRQGDQ